MPNPITRTRFYSDFEGESHFEDLEFDMALMNLVPHVSPHRQLFIVLTGEIEI